MGQDSAENRQIRDGPRGMALGAAILAEALKSLLPFLKSARWCPYTNPASIY